MAIKPTVLKIGDAALTTSIVDRSITELQDDVITTLQPYALAYCPALKKAVFGEVTEVLNNCFDGDEALERLEFYACAEFDASALQGLSGLKTLVLYSDTMCDASSGALLSHTPIEEGTGYIYVPAALVDSYKHDFIWSTYESQIRAIEDYPDVLSTLGHDWTMSNDVGGTTASDLFCVNGRLFAGVSSAQHWTSTDGKNWTKNNSVRIDSIAYGAGVYVLGGYGFGLFYSSDGENWTSCNVVHYDHLVYGNGLFLVANKGSKGVSYSEDGKTWQTDNLPDANVFGTVYANGLFLCACLGAGVFYSEDGKSWEKVPNITYSSKVFYRNGIYFANDAAFSSTDGLYWSADGKNWAKTNITGQNAGAMSLEYANGLWVCYASGSKTGAYFSEDGKTWTKATGHPASQGCIVYANGRWFSLTGVGVFSGDGKTWEQVSDFKALPSFGEYFNGLLVAAGSYTIGGGIYYSE